MSEDDVLAGCTGFDWDEGNLVKNWERHRVSASECEQIFFNRPLVTSSDPQHSAEEVRFFALGHTDGGRLLFVVFTVRKQRIRVISARDMSRKERKVYEQS
jgi:uncharacterized DUF497 family protein